MNSNHLPLELDHIFIWVKPSAPEASVLEEIGIKLTPNTREHHGQGTASKFFFFENAYLELIWISDEKVAQQSMERIGIDWRSRANWQQTGASPFGVGLHRTLEPADLTLFSLKHWAEWMQPNTSIHFADSVTNNLEPLYFIVPEYMSFTTRLEQHPENIKELVELHSLGVKKLTNVKITITDRTESTPIYSLLSEQNIIEIQTGTSSLLELTFDGGVQGKSFDAQPILPIVLKC